MKNVCVLVPTTNSEGKRDVTGAFLPESRRFAQMMRKAGHVVSEHAIDNTQALPARRKQALGALTQASSTQPLDVIAMFCHGWRDGVQHGFTRKTQASFCALPMATDVLVILYCCSTGDNGEGLAAPGAGDGSFSDTLRDNLCAATRSMCRVVAHTTVAHTTRNPNVLFFEGLGSSVGGTGGLAPVTPKHALWKPWKLALRGNNDFRFRFPSMTIAEIHQELIDSA